MVDEADIAAAVMARFNASMAKAGCPGGLWYGRVNEQAAAPYATLDVMGEDPVRLSDRRYHRWFGLSIQIWGDDGADRGSDAGTAARAIDAMMADLAVPAAIKVVDVKPGTGDLDIEPSPRRADDVVMVVRNWRILIEGQ